jgi:hypothetical protein
MYQYVCESLWGYVTGNVATYPQVMQAYLLILDLCCVFNSYKKVYKQRQGDWAGLVCFKLCRRRFISCCVVMKWSGGRGGRGQVGTLPVVGDPRLLWFPPLNYIPLSSIHVAYVHSPLISFCFVYNCRFQILISYKCSVKYWSAMRWAPKAR